MSKNREAWCESLLNGKTGKVSEGEKERWGRREGGMKVRLRGRERDRH